MNPMTIGGSFFMAQVLEMSKKNDMKIDIEIGPSCKKNYIKLYKKLRTTIGELRTKNKKIEISETGLQTFDVGRLMQEVALFLTID